MGTIEAFLVDRRGPRSSSWLRMRFALIAHDAKKSDLCRFILQHKTALAAHEIIATGTTGGRLAEVTGLPVTRYLSGPLGGDAQIGARIANGEVDAVIFIVDPLTAHPHEPDVQGLQRLCNVHNIPLATNLATAQMVLGTMLSRAER